MHKHTEMTVAATAGITKSRSPSTLLPAEAKVILERIVAMALAFIFTDVTQRGEL